jgi:predicted outer membrane repeat protein
VQNNTGPEGGGIYSSGALTLESGTTVEHNQALGGEGYSGGYYGWSGGSAEGGGVYVAGGTLTHRQYRLDQLPEYLRGVHRDVVVEERE